MKGLDPFSGMVVALSVAELLSVTDQSGGCFLYLLSEFQLLKFVCWHYMLA